MLPGVRTANITQRMVAQMTNPRVTAEFQSLKANFTPLELTELQNYLWAYLVEVDAQSRGRDAHPEDVGK